jgi:hypothetical protein
MTAFAGSEAAADLLLAVVSALMVGSRTKNLLGGATAGFGAKIGHQP